MTRRRTGPGRIEPNVNPAFLIVRLYNFDTDWHELKPEHTDWLDEISAPRLRAAAGVYVLGLASRSGDEQHNRDLSNRRREAVLDHLFRGGRPTIQVHGGWAGEDHAYGRSEDDQYDRAAVVSIWPQRTQPAPDSRPTPRPTPRLRAPPRVSTGPAEPSLHRRFRMRMVRAGSLGIGMSATFEIEDARGQQRATYEYRGVGPPLPGLPISWTGAGPWNAFQTTTAMTAHDFGGIAEIDSIGLPPKRFMDRTIQLPAWTAIVLSPRRTTPIALRNFQTGDTQGFGLSAFVGDFQRRR